MRGFLNKKCLINLSSSELLTKEKVAKSLIPLSWCLFKSIKSFLKLIHMSRIFMILKTGRLRNIEFLFNVYVYKNNLHIHLVQFKVHNTSKCKQQSHNFQSSYRSIGFTKVYILLLVITFAY